VWVTKVQYLYTHWCPNSKLQTPSLPLSKFHPTGCCFKWFLTIHHNIICAFVTLPYIYFSSWNLPT